MLTHHIVTNYITENSWDYECYQTDCSLDWLENCAKGDNVSDRYIRFECRYGEKALFIERNFKEIIKGMNKYQELIVVVDEQFYGDEIL